MLINSYSMALCIGANASGSNDTETYKSNYIQLQDRIDEIMLPIRALIKDGGHMASSKIKGR